MEKIVCPGCGASYHLKSETPKGARLRAKCKKCGATFLVELPLTNDNPIPAINSDNNSDTSDNEYKDKPVLDRPVQEGGHDYLAVGVLLVALLAFVFFGYMGIKTFLKGDMLEPVKTLTNKILQETLFTSSNKKPTHRKRLTYDDAVKAGHRYFRKNDYKKAIQYYALAERLAPQETTPLYWHAQALHKRGQREEAIKKLKKLLKIDPKYVPAHKSLGWIYMKSRKWDQAVESLTKAIQLDPKDGWSYYNRGRCNFKLGKYQEALADAKRACDLGFELGCRVYKKYSK